MKILAFISNISNLASKTNMLLYIMSFHLALGKNPILQLIKGKAAMTDNVGKPALH